MVQASGIISIFHSIGGCFTSSSMLVSSSLHLCRIQSHRGSEPQLFEREITVIVSLLKFSS